MLQDKVAFSSVVLISAMFAYSGLRKIVKLGNTETKHFTKNLKLSLSVSKALVFAAGVVEVVAVGMLYFDSTRRAGLVVLIMFTLLVTVVFKLWPTLRIIPLLSNLAVVGGLLALARIYYGPKFRI